MITTPRVEIGGLAGLRTGETNAAPADKQRQQALAAANDFEAVFMSELMKQMRSSLEPETLFPGDSGDVFGGLFDLYMGQHMAKTRSLGVTDMVDRYLQTKQDT